MFLAHYLTVAIGLSSQLLFPLCVLGTGPQPSPSLRFQSDPNLIPALSFESWSDAQNAAINSGDPNPINQKKIGSEKLPEEASQRSSEIADDFEAAFGKNNNVLTTLRGIFDSLAVLLQHPAPPNHPPPHGHEPIDLSKYTIWQVLDWILQNNHKESAGEHHLPLYRLAWVANLSEPIKHILSDPNADITFFAPDDEALTPPHKKKGDAPGHDGFGQEQYLADIEGDIVSSEPDHPVKGCIHAVQKQFENEDGSDKEKKRKIILHIIESVLRYHISPTKKTIHQLFDSSTIPTDLRISHDHSAPKFRIKVGVPPPFFKPGELALNFFTKIGGPGSRPIITKNGVIYVAHEAPLFPPLSPLSQLFLFPRPYSTLTSAIQKVHLDHLLLPHFGDKIVPLNLEAKDEEKNIVEGGLSYSEDLNEVDERVKAALAALLEEKKPEFHKRSFTVFAPTNRAFRALGFRLNAFLFSPLGAHVLRYVLSYHIVPDIIWHSDHIDNVTDVKAVMERYESEIELPEEYERYILTRDNTFRSRFGRPDHGKVNVVKYSLPTLLGSRKNETLKSCCGGPINRRVFVENGVHPPHKEGSPEDHHRTIPVILPDGVAWGGAVHTIPKLICPPVPAGQKGVKGLTPAIRALGRLTI
ncbi:hypothetical protein PPACK8108_LOCUS13180 [Phakopsora pachyrhizi]|uniref:FAS1 domain-containing protein n=1 Tax=Phakopsora pachyrhizi TaxID=170000 RepID=A0AAV0B581_PHAPC|nr:hypothetical protein PPACK8108_LOCUS13180 [Phakopsora pachyrhizi]